MENEKKSFLIFFEDKTKFNMIMHIKKEKVDNFFIVYLEPRVRLIDETKDSRHKITNCRCDKCSKREAFLTESSKKEGIFNGWGFSDEEFISFVSIKLNTFNGIEALLEKINGEKHRCIYSVEKEKLSDPVALSRYYANSGLEGLLKDLGFR